MREKKNVIELQNYYSLRRLFNYNRFLDQFPFKQRLKVCGYVCEGVNFEWKLLECFFQTYC